MRRLEVSGSGWTGEELSNLPPQLETLEMWQCSSLNTEDARRLPNTLTKLTLLSQTPTISLLANLPDSIQTLIITTRHALVSEPPNWKDMTLKLPKSLTMLDLNFTFLKHHMLGFPVALTELNMANTNVHDDWIPLLPQNLTHLSIPQDTTLTDAGLVHLPPGLLVLVLEENQRITDVGVASLPRNMMALIMCKNRAITDAGVAALPRTLVHINLMTNTNFTIFSLYDWPPFLECAEFNISEEYCKPEASFGHSEESDYSSDMLL